jgi:peptidoglycan/LPS O-acetylase OafA/YrhL
VPAAPPAAAPASHRLDIQGLRALCVAAVVAFHLRPGWLPGGYLGVDVFFVISGYLITQQLLRQQERGVPVLARFYAARMRRLLPNALLCLAACLVLVLAAWPRYLHERMGQDVAAAALDLANFQFARRAVEYFSTGAGPSIALHFWSLSVEEQFYVFWPLALLAAGRTGLRARRVVVPALLVVVIAASLWHASVLGRHDQPLAFFSSAARAWELALGALAAALDGRTAFLRGGFAASVARGAALLAIAAAMVAGSEELQSAQLALLPAVACVLLLGSGGAGAGAGRSPVDAFLASPLLTWLGDRSYSLYLWHWPVILLLGRWWAPSGVQAAVAVATTVLVAGLAYRWVERPVHRGRVLAGWQPWHVVLASLAAMALVAGAGLFLPRKTTADSARVAMLQAAAKDLAVIYRDKCHLASEEVRSPPCVYGDAAASRRVVLFGDSHAAQWFPALDAAARAPHWRLESRTKTPCPAADITVWHKARGSVYAECDAWRESVLAELERNPPALVFVASLTRYDGWVFDRSARRVLPRNRVEAEWKAGLARTLRRLRAKGIGVVVVRDTPRLAPDYRDCVEAAESTRCATPAALAVSQPSPDVEVASRFAGVRILDFIPRICPDGECAALQGGRLLYLDAQHLTSSAAARYASAFADLLR